MASRQVLASASMVIIASVVVIATLDCGVVSPRRPRSVPAEAIWAGGADGGAWIWCHPVGSELDLQTCKVFYDSGPGDIWAQGDYVLRRVEWDPHAQRAKYHRVDARSTLPQYEAFDGTTIYLQGQLVLIPSELESSVKQINE